MKTARWCSALSPLIDLRRIRDSFEERRGLQSLRVYWRRKVAATAGAVTLARPLVAIAEDWCECGLLAQACEAATPVPCDQSPCNPATGRPFCTSP